jgi:putative transcriptional regulator
LWATTRIHRAGIEDAARAEYEELGIDASRLKFYRVLSLPTPDIKKIRQRLHLSKSQFANRFGLSTRTLQEWEQGRSEPDQTARLLLSLIELSPTKIGMMVNEITTAVRLAKRK